MALSALLSKYCLSYMYRTTFHILHMKNRYKSLFYVSSGDSLEHNRHFREGAAIGEKTHFQGASKKLIRKKAIRCRKKSGWKENVIYYYSRSNNTVKGLVASYIELYDSRRSLHSINLAWKPPVRTVIHKKLVREKMCMKCSHYPMTDPRRQTPLNAAENE